MKKLTKKQKQKLANWLATVAGLITAISMDLLLIDWKEFDIKKEWPKLLLSILVAAGGYLSRFKFGDKSNSNGDSSKEV